jgi:hypothetical protein
MDKTVTEEQKHVWREAASKVKLERQRFAVF